jgi:hypothetical protein
VTERAKELIQDIKHHSAELTRAENELLELVGMPKVSRVDIEPPKKAKPAVVRVVKTPGGGEKQLEVPQEVVSRILDRINEEPERIWLAGDIATALPPIRLAVATAALLKLKNDGFIRCVGRGRFMAQTNDEPKMGLEDDDEAVA